MKRLFFLSALLCIYFTSLTIQAQNETNCYVFTYFISNGEHGLHLAYSHDGLTWAPLNEGKPFIAPMVGKDKLMRDPCIIKGVDGMYHMVWTTSWTENGIGVAHSKDLIEWSEQTFVPVMAHEPDAKNCWAPEVFYNDIDKEYLIFWATTIPGRFLKTDEQGDSNYNHRMYSVTTKDFKSYSDTKLFYDPGFNVIDSTIFKKDDNQYVMILKNETRRPPEKNLRVATATNPAGSWSSASKPITGEYWAEGPTTLKIGEYWYVYFDKYVDHKYGAVRSKELQEWEDVSDSVHFPEGFRHGTVLQVECSVLEKLKAFSKE